MALILAGDIGGTKTVLALYERASDGIRQLEERVFTSADHRTFDEIVASFLHGTRHPLHAGCFGVAGAVIDGHCQTTNLPWALEERALAASIGAPRVKLLNDLEAAAHSVLFLSDDDLAPLNPGRGRRVGANIAVIAAGTGLGEAMLMWDGAQYHAIASEGGHADFAPRTDEQIELYRYLRAQFGHVSYERVLSGPGFYNIYCFLRDSGYAPEPLQLRQRLAGDDPSVKISKLGVAGDDPLCARTVELFATIYGAEAGNLALKCLGVGGVFVAGGIGPKILPVLRNGSFMRGFVDKGRFAELTHTIPVNVVLNPRAPLIGAAHYALRVG